ncbi:MAG: endonuclease III [Candidatus Micrarchaeaceae archaeon]
MAFKQLSDEKINEALATLERAYPDAKYYLNFSTPIDLLVAAILSAQTHDEVVNAATAELFKHFKTARDYSNARPEELLKYIGKVSFAGKKAISIIEACKIIAEKYGGKVPNKMSELVELPGIGRKTANTILINAYGIVEGIPVDTWVIKLSYRIGITEDRDPEKIEEKLMRVLDKKYWHNIAYVLKRHGHQICHSQAPLCSKCVINAICPKNGVKGHG